MKTNFNLLFLLVASALPASPAAADTVNYTVPSSANISSAGLLSPVGPGGGGAGTLPVLHPITPGQSIVILSVSGEISQFFDSYYHSSDGLAGFPMDIASYGGISGFKADVNTPLVGVFLSDDPPVGPAPPTLDFTSAGLGLNFGSLSPQLGQVFFIGDGRGITDNHLLFFQSFKSPAGATRLYLGFADAPFSMGDPGAFDDNRGSLSVNLLAVPEPTAINLFLAGGLMYGLRPVRRRSPQGIGH